MPGLPRHLVQKLNVGTVSSQGSTFMDFFISPAGLVTQNVISFEMFLLDLKIYDKNVWNISILY